ncbi:MAG: SOS response-associated peptidase [Chloroflexota bacterium]
MTQQTDPAVLAEIFDAEVRDPADEVMPRYNVAPTDVISTVLQRDDGRFVERMRWGFLPPWAKKPAEGARMINARAETVASSPAFRGSFARRRCIVPVDGFYEWDRIGGSKQPYLLRPPAEGVLAFAGIWTAWKDPGTGLWVPSAAVITTRANDAIGVIHDRMPVLLPRDAWARWLDPALPDPGELQGLLEPAPDDVLLLVPVSRAVNSVRNDSPDLLVPVIPGADAPPPKVVAPPPPGPVQGTLFD